MLWQPFACLSARAALAITRSSSPPFASQSLVATVSCTLYKRESTRLHLHLGLGVQMGIGAPPVPHQAKWSPSAPAECWSTQPKFRYYYFTIK
eukprot:scaffold14092_cov122-Isochrysis_galbana.AAC.6